MMRSSIARKVWHLMLPQQRRGAAVLLGLMLLGTVLETVSVGLVTPILAFMSQNGPTARHSLLDGILAHYPHVTRGELLVTAMVVLVAVYAVKAVYLALLSWRQSRFIFALQINVSRQLVDGYLAQPYTFHLQRNSAQMIRNVVSETSQFSHLAVIPGMTMLSEGLVLVGIGSLLMLIEPIGALLVMLTIGFAGYLFHRATRMRLLRWGEAREHHEGMRIQHLQQGLGGVKDVKLLGRESQFLEKYVLHDVGVARVQERQLTLQALPRLWLELLGITGLAALVLSMLVQGKPVDALVPTLGLFAAAAFRLMPSVSKVLTAIQSLRYAEPVVDTLNAEIEQLRKGRMRACKEPVPFERALQLEGLCYQYPGASVPALRGVSLEISRGSSVGFVGGSGAGKSTLIDVILGLLPPTEGAVRVDGKDIQSALRGWQNQIGYVPQTIYLTDDTLRANVAFGLPEEQIDETAVWRALRAAQLEQFVKQLPTGLETIVGERGVRLSGGQRQRIGIARALYHDPAVLVLDEATSSLDTATEQGVMDAVKALSGEKTVLIVAHRISTVEHCATVVRLDQGMIAAAGDPKTILFGATALYPDAGKLPCVSNH